MQELLGLANIENKILLFKTANQATKRIKHLCVSII
jgi:hypothetical protein